MNVRVRFRGNDIVVENIKTVVELNNVLYDKTGALVKNQKLVAKGGLLVTDEYVFKSGELLQLIGASVKEIEQVKQVEVDASENYEVKQVRNDLDVDYEELAAKRKVAARKKGLEDRKQQALSSPYRFQSIKALPGFSDQQKATDILEDLAYDAGFVEVLKKHKWTVGSLEEMYPDGKVGVDPVCVLGYNQNHGMKICLRLRTDDLKGFRKIAVIRETLCHELAHNVHSDHDEKIYMLMRQIQKEVVELDWRKRSTGHQLGGREYLNAAIVASRLPPKALGGVYKLGGGVGGPRTDAKLLAADAAAQRRQRTKEESKSGAEESVSLPNEKEFGMAESSDDTVGKRTSRVVETRNGEQMEKEKEQQRKVEMMDADELQVFESAVEMEVDDMSLTQQQVIQEAIAQVVERNPREKASEALRLLVRVTGNVLKDPSNVKFRKLNLENTKVKKNLSSVLGARKILNVIGWTLIDENQLLLLDEPGILGRHEFTRRKLGEMLELVSLLDEE